MCVLTVPVTSYANIDGRAHPDISQFLLDGTVHALIMITVGRPASDRHRWPPHYLDTNSGRPSDP